MVHIQRQVSEEPYYYKVRSYETFMDILDREGIELSEIPALIYKTTYRKLLVVAGGLAAAVHGYIVYVAGVVPEDGG